MAQTGQAGRPRDPAVEDRLTSAAVALFGEAGYTGFNFDVLSRRSGVGKASIYLRWKTKEELLVAALSRHLGPINEVDTGNVRSDLIALAGQLLQSYLGDSGKAFMRLGIEAQDLDAIGEQYRAWSRSQILAARAIVRRGIARGELQPETSVTLVLDTLCGGAIIHATSAPLERREQVRREAASYAVELVDFVLRSVIL